MIRDSTNRHEMDNLNYYLLVVGATAIKLNSYENVLRDKFTLATISLKFVGAVNILREEWRPTDQESRSLIL